jgi:hypothetical protein
VGSNEHSVRLLGVPVEEFELDLDHVVKALAPLGRRRSGRRDCGALRRRPEPPSVNADKLRYVALLRIHLHHNNFQTRCPISTYLAEFVFNLTFNVSPLSQKS